MLNKKQKERDRKLYCKCIYYFYSASFSSPSNDSSESNAKIMSVHSAWRGLWICWLYSPNSREPFVQHTMFPRIKCVADAAPIKRTSYNFLETAAHASERKHRTSWRHGWRLPFSVLPDEGFPRTAKSSLDWVVPVNISRLVQLAGIPLTRSSLLESYESVPGPVWAAYARRCCLDHRPSPPTPGTFPRSSSHFLKQLGVCFLHIQKKC